MKGMLIAVSPLLLVACLSNDVPSESPEEDCGARELGYLVGQPENVLERMRFAEPVRILEFGQPMTMDYNPARLNIQKGRSGKIARVWCG